MAIQCGRGVDVRGFTGVISFRFQPHRMALFVPKPKYFGFQRRAISRTCATIFVKRSER